MLKKSGSKRYLPFTIATTALAVMAFVIVSACTDRQAKAKPVFVTKDAPKAGIVAKIGNEEITEEQLIGEDKVDFFDIKKREYELKMERMNKLLVDKLIGAEAKKANMPTEEYIAKKIAKGNTKPSDSDYKKFVADKKIPEAQINPQIKERIIAYLETQKKQQIVDEYVAKLTKSVPVEVYFKKPRMEVQVEIGNAPVWGNAKAPITVIEYSDFQCPFCSRGADTINELKKKYSGKVKIAFKHYPLPMHKEAKPASEASMCVNEQSSDKFWKFHDLVFKNQDKLDNASLEKYAKDSGADVKKFKECFDSKKYEAAVKADMEYGEKIGVKSTPTFFINGQIVNGAVPIDTFVEMIEDELNNKK